MYRLTGEQCVELHGRPGLRRYVIERATERARRPEEMEKCVATAWLAIWRTCKPGQDEEHYQAVARRAIKAACRCRRPKPSP